MKKILSFLLVSIFVFSVSAKGIVSPDAKPAAINENVTTIKLSGLICDKNTKENLAGAVITVNGQKLYSDLDGKFEINNCNNSVIQVKVSMISYKDKTLDININNASNIQIELNQR